MAPQGSPTRKKSSIVDLTRVDSFGQINARFGLFGCNPSILKQQYQKEQRRKKDEPTQREFRLARYGPGYVVGYLEYITGLPSPGHILAVTNCRLHFLPFEFMDDIEIESPLVLMHLYKLLARIIASRYDSATEQLSILRNIISTPGITTAQKPMSRIEAAATPNLRLKSRRTNSSSSFTALSRTNSFQ